MQAPQNASWSTWAWNGTFGRFWPSSAPSSSPSTTGTDSTTKTYTMAEVRKHNKEADCWIIIANKVYNVTLFLEKHPGGADQILGQAGQDATNAFKGVGHSADAQITLAEYYIGELAKAALG